MNPGNQRVAIVTGAGKGLGRAYAEYLAGQGIRVLVNNRCHQTDAPGETSAEQVVRAIRSAGGEAIANLDGVDDPRSGQRMVEQALGTWGRLDILIANAGVELGEAFHKMTLESLQRVMGINFFGTFHAVHAAYPVMREARHGRIVVTISTAGLHGNHGMTAYSSSKAALIGLMRSLALEGASRNVHVNAIAPFAATPMTSHHLPEALARKLSTDHVAPVVAWLVSEECALNGEILIAGRGVLRRAATIEARGGTLPGGARPTDVREAWPSSADMGAAVEFASSHDAFLDLMQR